MRTHLHIARWQRRAVEPQKAPVSADQSLWPGRGHGSGGAEQAARRVCAAQEAKGNGKSAGRGGSSRAFEAVPLTEELRGRFGGSVKRSTVGRKALCHKAHPSSQEYGFGTDVAWASIVPLVDCRAGRQEKHERGGLCLEEGP